MINKNKRKWGYLPYKKGLLHKWRFIEYKIITNEIKWLTFCGLQYDEYPHPHFQAKGMKCKKCQKTDIALSKNKGY